VLSPDLFVQQAKEETMYRIEIDRTLCSGFGACAELAPELFELDGGGTASVRIGETDDERALDAASACPMGAISVIETRAA
jgi:ferredoxin